MDRDGKGKNHVARTIIYPRKEFGRSRGSNQLPSVHKSWSLLTELPAFRLYSFCQHGFKALFILNKIPTSPYRKEEKMQ